MSQIKEAIKLLEKILEIRWASKPDDNEWHGYCFIITADNRNLILGSVSEAVTLLRPLDEEPKCKYCNDAGKLEVWCRGLDHEIPQYVPCKYCQVKEPVIPPKPLYGEARSRLLKAMGCTNVDDAIEKWNALQDRCPSWMGKEKGCNEAEEPPQGEFSKSYGRVLDAVVIAFATTDDKIIQQQVQVAVDWGRKARHIIDRQAAELKKLLGDLDAECRVSQMLLASQKKIKGHLEQALLYSDPPHPAAKERIKEAQEYLDSLK